MEKIPLNIGKEHVIKAIERIDKEGVPHKRVSRKFNVHYKGKLYPPKYLISVANESANRDHLNPKNFVTYHAQSVLNRLGFETQPRRS
jgi:hypothetical protein